MINGRRQPSRGGTSRISREAHVRFCEGLGVKFPGPTRHPRPVDTPAAVAVCPLHPRNVWTRRALQEKTVSLEYGLAPMYQASLWSSCSGPSWKSARTRSC